MVGATMFLGNIAFAQKNEESKKQIPPQAIEKVNGTVPAHEKAQLPEQVGKNQGKAKQQPVEGKPSVPGKSLPEQAKGKGNGLSTAQEKNNGIGNKKPNPIIESGTSDIDSKPNIKTHGKHQGQSVKFTPKRKDHYNPILYPVKDQQKDRDNPNPSDEEEIPKGQMPNQTQRTSGHGGKTNDRIHPALNGMNFLDDGYLWNFSYDIQLLVKFYYSQKIWMSNQWMNAPPSQPPQVAPLLETVSSN